MRRLVAIIPALCSLLLLGQAPAPGPLRSGPMLGYAELTEASVWLQTRGDASVRLRYHPEGRPGDARTTPVTKTSAETHRIARFVIPGLAPGTTYRYEILVDGAAVPSGSPRTFRTQVLWHYRAAPPDFAAAVGSCFFQNDAAVDRPGRPYGKGNGIFLEMARLKPDLMIWLGDNVYYREVDFGSAASLAERNAKAREAPELRDLLASARNYATWDDHDFGPDNAAWTYRLSGEALRLFKLFWSNPTYGHNDIAGVFGQFSWSDVDFFLLDDRWYRTPDRAVNAAEKRMLGERQMRWLQDALLQSSAPFKIVANGSQMLNENTQGDSFTTYPTEYRALIDWIVLNRISGVVFLTGDRHITQLLRTTPEGFYTLYDFTSSPLTANSWVAKDEAQNPQLVPGTLVDNMQSFGMLRVSGPCNDRVLTMEAYDATGAKRWTQAIRARDLFAPGTAEKDRVGHFGCRWLKEPR
ncbi:MAG TPA: alkaline phosphatase D family protein [Thermoanaerobaculia bacterium]